MSEFNPFLAHEFERLRREGVIAFQVDDKVYAPEDVTIVKSAAYLPISNELAMEYGLIPDTRPPAPPIPWWRRLRYRTWRWRDAAALKLYRLVAGHDPEVDCDC